MDISPARLTSLLKEALTPQPVPTAKADPATAALVKALVQPAAPSVVPSAQLAAQALNGALLRPAPDLSRRLASGEIEHAYRAVMEPRPGAGETLARAPAGRAPIDGDRPLRGPALAQTAIAEGVAAIAAAPSLPVAAIAASPTGAAAANSNAPPRGGSRPGHAPRSEPGPTPLRAIPIATAVVSAAAVAILLILLR
jgi:hypothetical protein